MQTRFHIATVVLLSLSLATTAAAQGPPPGSIAAPSDKDCKKAAHIVEKGKPDKKEEWAFTTIVRCPDDVSASGAKAISEMRTVLDTASLRAAWVPLFRIVDAQLMSAYIDVVGDRTASAAARTLAMSALLAMQGDGMAGVSNRSLTTDGENCQVGYATAPPPPRLRPSRRHTGRRFARP